MKEMKAEKEKGIKKRDENEIGSGEGN